MPHRAFFTAVISKNLKQFSPFNMQTFLYKVSIAKPNDRTADDDQTDEKEEETL